MFSQDDIHRSLRRWAWQALGIEFSGRVYTTREEIVGKDRPFAYVEPNGPPTPLGVQRTARFRGSFYDTSREFVISAYPSADGDARAARQRAEALVSRLYGAVTVGLYIPAVPAVPADPPDIPDDIPAVPAKALGGPRRIPLYDFEGVALDEAGPDDPYDHAWVARNWNVRSIVDDDDERQFTVPLVLSLSWRSPGPIPLDEVDAPVVDGMSGTFVEP